MKSIVLRMIILFVGLAQSPIVHGDNGDPIPNAEYSGPRDQHRKELPPGNANASGSPEVGGRGAPKRRPRPITEAPGGPEDSGRGPGLGAPGKPGGPGGPAGPGAPEGPIGLKRGNETSPP